MYALIRSVSLRQLLFERAPALGTSLLIAEMFYKLHSFTLEFIAFLGTWYAIDAIFSFFLVLFRQREMKEKERRAS